MSKQDSHHDTHHDSTPPYAVEVARALPYVGRVLAVLARQALRSNEQDSIRACLADALRPADAKVGWRSLLNGVLHPRLTRAAKRARRQAALDIAAVAKPTDLGARDRTDDVTVVATLPVAAPAVGQGKEEAQNQLLELGKFVRSELQKATEAERFIPWTERVSGVLAVGAHNTWEQRAARIEEIDEALAEGRLGAGADVSSLRKERREYRLALDQMHAAVLNQTPAAEVPDVVPKQPSEDEFGEFGDRVGMRLVANMACHNQLQILVRRLDKQDGQRAEAAMVTAVQGLRVAVLAVAAVLIVATAALIEMAL